MPKFRVGDLVRCVTADPTSFLLVNGQEYEVIGHSVNGGLVLKGIARCFSGERFELIRPARAEPLEVLKERLLNFQAREGESMEWNIGYSAALAELLEDAYGLRLEAKTTVTHEFVPIEKDRQDV